jgi:hypothetical protein
VSDFCKRLGRIPLDLRMGEKTIGNAKEEKRWKEKK